MDWFRKQMRGGGVMGWRRTDGRAGSRGGQSNRKMGHQIARRKLKEELDTEQPRPEEESGLFGGR